MKYAVLSDIHANLAALEAITEDIEQWNPDFVVVNGDVINRGPQPAECWAFVQERMKTCGWQLTRGNHEEYVLNHLEPASNKKSFPLSAWTLKQMEGYIPQLRAMETSWSDGIGTERGEIRVIHASMAGSRAGIYPSDSQELVREYIDPAPAVLVVGHIHLPFVRLIDQTMLVNAGSAGQPCYGEKKGCYAQIKWENKTWQAEIRRIPYDRATTQAAWLASGIFNETDLVTQMIYHEWRTANPLLLKWMREYAPMVDSGEYGEEELLGIFFEREGLGDPRPDDLL